MGHRDMNDEPVTSKATRVITTEMKNKQPGGPDNKIANCAKQGTLQTIQIGVFQLGSHLF